MRRQLVLFVFQKIAYRPAMPVDNLTPAAPPVQIIASMPLRRMTSSKASAGPVGRFAPRSNL